MKLLLKLILRIIVFVILVVGIMFIFRLCPPPGPWISPPWCDGLAITKETPTTLTIFVSVPHNTPNENISLLIEGREAILMTKVGELSYQATLDVMGQQIVNYKFMSGVLYSDNYSVVVDKKDFTKYNGIFSWDNLEFQPSFAPNFKFGAMMFDTWGRNYNYKMIENTRNNIDSSFKRLASLGIKQVFVTDMIRAKYKEGYENYSSTNYELEDEIFSNDFRDESINQKDMNELAKKAHAYGLDIGLEINIGFIDYGKFIGSKDISGELHGEEKKLNAGRTKEWIEDFYNKKEQKYLEIASMLDSAGFDSMFVTQRGVIKNVPYDSYANERLKDLIYKIQKKYNLKVNAFVYDWGLISQEWNASYDYYKKVDDVYLVIEKIEDRYKPQLGMDFQTIKSKFSQELNSIEMWANKNSVQLNIYFGPFSYKDAIALGGVEFNDTLNDDINSLEPAWQEQADAYEAFLQAAENRDFIESINFMLFWWDDAMNPDTAKTLINISSSPRNKNAEAVMYKWGKAME